MDTGYGAYDFDILARRPIAPRNPKLKPNDIAQRQQANYIDGIEARKHAGDPAYAGTFRFSNNNVIQVGGGQLYRTSSFNPAYIAEIIREDTWNVRR